MRLILALLVSIAATAQVSIKGPISVKGPISAGTSIYSPPSGWSQISNTAIDTMSGVPTEGTFPGITGNYATHPQQGITRDWGGAWSIRARKWMCMDGGGHTSYYGNEVYCINLNQATPQLARMNDPTLTTARGCDNNVTNGFVDAMPPNPAPVTQTQGGHEVCGSCTGAGCKAPSVHSYNFAAVDEVTGNLVRVGGATAGTASNLKDMAWELDLSNFSFSSPITSSATQWTQYTPVSGFGSRDPNLAYDYATDKLWGASQIQLYEYDRTGHTWTARGSGYSKGTYQTGAAVYSPAVGTHYLYVIGWGIFKKFNLSTYALTSLEGASGCTTPQASYAPGLVYWESKGKLVVYVEETSELYYIDPTTDTCSLITISGTPPTPIAAITANGIWSRLQYFPSGDFAVLWHDTSENVYTIKLP